MDFWLRLWFQLHLNCHRNRYFIGILLVFLGCVFGALCNSLWLFVTFEDLIEHPLLARKRHVLSLMSSTVSFAGLVNADMLTGRTPINIELDHMIDVHINLTVVARSRFFWLEVGRVWLLSVLPIRSLVLIKLWVKGGSIHLSFEG